MGETVDSFRVAASVVKENEEKITKEEMVEIMTQFMVFLKAKGYETNAIFGPENATSLDDIGYYIRETRNT